MDDIYTNIEEYNPNKKRKKFIVFDDMIADILSNKKRNSIVTEWLIRERKLKICLVFITQSYFAASKNIKLNSRHYFVMKIPSKREFQHKLHLIIHQILSFQTLRIFIKTTAKPNSFLVIDTIPASDNSSRFRKNLLETI